MYMGVCVILGCMKLLNFVLRNKYKSKKSCEVLDAEGKTIIQTIQNQNIKTAPVVNKVQVLRTLVTHEQVDVFMKNRDGEGISRNILEKKTRNMKNNLVKKTVRSMREFIDLRDGIGMYKYRRNRYEQLHTLLKLTLWQLLA